jgi:hypothetical protein
MRTLLAVILLVSFAPASDSTSAPVPARPLPRVVFYRQMTFTGLRCNDAQAPVPLSTPDSLFLNTAATVNVIVGIDGKVYSPIVEEGPATAMRGLSQWRFRPATCNGVPAEAEGRIKFIVR